MGKSYGMAADPTGCLLRFGVRVPLPRGSGGRDPELPETPSPRASHRPREPGVRPTQRRTLYGRIGWPRAPLARPRPRVAGLRRTAAPEGGERRLVQRLQPNLEGGQVRPAAGSAVPRSERGPLHRRRLLRPAQGRSNGRGCHPASGCRRGRAILLRQRRRRRPADGEGVLHRQQHQIPEKGVEALYGDDGRYGPVHELRPGDGEGGGPAARHGVCQRGRGQQGRVVRACRRDHIPQGAAVLDQGTKRGHLRGVCQFVRVPGQCPPHRRRGVLGRSQRRQGKGRVYDGWWGWRRKASWRADYGGGSGWGFCGCQAR